MVSDNTRRRRLIGTVIGAAGILLWATETALITFTGHLPPLQTVALAFAAAALVSALCWPMTGGNPLLAFRQPARVWVLTVGSLVGFHACIYYAVQKAPPATAALLQGTTPLMIVLGSALLPGERLRWWHLAGAATGLAGVLALLSGAGAPEASYGAHSAFYLAIVGAAAAIWGLYSLVSRLYSDVPTSAMGVFFAAAAIVAAAGHLFAETWTPPSLAEWTAIAALGAFPMGLALLFWDYGVKRGDIQALGAFSYVEPFVGALLVVVLGQGALSWGMFWGGVLIVGGAALAGRGIWSGDGQDNPVYREIVIDWSPAAARVESGYAASHDREIVIDWSLAADTAALADVLARAHAAPARPARRAPVPIRATA